MNLGGAYCYRSLVPNRSETGDEKKSPWISATPSFAVMVSASLRTPDALAKLHIVKSRSSATKVN